MLVRDRAPLLPKIAFVLVGMTVVGDLAAATAGRFITARIDLIVALLITFITCPMFRQYSPVAGVCDLGQVDDP